jgi:hypothetical protein
MRWTLQLAHNVESSRRWLQLPPVTMRGGGQGKGRNTTFLCLERTGHMSCLDLFGKNWAQEGQCLCLGTALLSTAFELCRNCELALMQRSCEDANPRP